MKRLRDPSSPMPTDQASGLRRMFAPVRRPLLPVAANPFVPGAGALLECLSAALVARGLHVLVVDAAASAPEPSELARLDLPACVEPLAEQVSYLAARGLPMAHVDTRGSAAGMLDAAFAAAPQAQVMLLHADVTDLARLLVGRAARPLLLGADRPESIKHAYACCKLLVQRCTLMTFDLVLSARPGNKRVRHIAASLTSCADGFLGAVLHDWTAIDPFHPAAADDAGLARVLAAQLALDEDPTPVPALLRHREPAGRLGMSRHPI